MKRRGAMISRLGFNGGMFDIKPRVADKIVAPETDEADVQGIDSIIKRSTVL